MPRRLRVWSPGMMYHITARGNRRGTLFHDSHDYKRYLLNLSLLKDSHHFLLHAYCLLPNHLHLLLETNQTPLSKSMHQLQTNYAKYYNHRYKKEGHVFEKRYYSDPIRDQAHFFQVSKYIHRNPVEAGLTGTVAEYRWSSGRDYAETPAYLHPQHPFLTFTRTLDAFPQPSQENYSLFMNRETLTPKEEF